MKMFAPVQTQHKVTALASETEPYSLGKTVSMAGPLLLKGKHFLTFFITVVIPFASNSLKFDAETGLAS